MDSGRYSVEVTREFVAQHALIGGDWGAENEKHSHHYRLRLALAGTKLDQHNYLVDIVVIESVLDRFVARYRDRFLNDCPAFAGTNPSLELFCRVAWEELVPEVRSPGVQWVTVTMWENEIARASYRAGVAGNV